MGWQLQPISTLAARCTPSEYTVKQVAWQLLDGKECEGPTGAEPDREGKRGCFAPSVRDRPGGVRPLQAISGSRAGVSAWYDLFEDRS